MARIEWVKTRLLNWSRWKAAANATGLGWATQAAFLRQPSGDDYQARIPIDEIEAGVTDEAVESLKVARPHIYSALQLIYVRDLGALGASRAMQCSVSNVHALLGVGDQVLSAWFTDRAEMQRQKREDIKKSFTP